MINYISILLIVLAGVWVAAENPHSDVIDVIDEMKVYEVALALGDQPMAHELNSTIPGVSSEKGRELFHTGYTTLPNGKRTKKQSRHYVCTSCHNHQKEDTDLGQPNPEDRMKYAIEHDLPFLQGTTMYGVVNRKTFYNQDYRKKYGEETINKVKEDLRESIQLCAVGCAQGRALNTWEIECVLAYYWDLQLKMSDLQLSKQDRQTIQEALSEGRAKEKALTLVKSKYLQAAPCTFGEPPLDWKEGYPLEGNAERGEMIYTKSCLHCHQEGRYSYYSLDTLSLSLNHLARNFPKEKSSYSSYKLITEGTYPLFGNKGYMPQYPLERMSRQQIEDLRAYVEQRQ